MAGSLPKGPKSFSRKRTAETAASWIRRPAGFRSAPGLLQSLCMATGNRFGGSKRRRRLLEREALEELRRIRQPLFRELEKLVAGLDHNRDPAPHLCCKRELNQMRISPLEARDIFEAFRRDPELRRRWPAVAARIREEAGKLRNTTERQNFDCPLLEGTRCLVHRVAKPIGCLAWNPGREFSRAAWDTFRRRDALNDALHGPDWRLQVIPIWLARLLRRDEGRRR